MADHKKSSRSERLRAQRTPTRSRKPVRESRSIQEKNRPPVLMRGNFSTTQPKKKRKTKSPKRRYDIALSTPGVEMQLPAMPAVSLGWRLASLILVGGLAFLIYHLWTAPFYQVQAAELFGNHYLTSEIVNRQLNLYNKPIFTIDPQQTEKDLQFAFQNLLEEVTVQVDLPASVIVTVQERQPVIAWEQDGKTLWIDANGIAFDPVVENEELVYVLASGSPPAPYITLDELDNSENDGNPLEVILAPEVLMKPEMVSAIITLQGYAPEGMPLIYDAQHGLGFHHPNRGWDVYFGKDVSNINEKLNVYKAIKAEMKQKGISPVMISVEHIHAPYYRLEP
jgi:hypothetical protein